VWVLLNRKCRLYQVEAPVSFLPFLLPTTTPSLHGAVASHSLFLSIRSLHSLPSFSEVHHSFTLFCNAIALVGTVQLLRSRSCKLPFPIHNYIQESIYNKRIIFTNQTDYQTCLHNSPSSGSCPSSLPLSRLPSALPPTQLVHRGVYTMALGRMVLLVLAATTPTTMLTDPLLRPRL
jgi:hypothetical protein